MVDLARNEVNLLDLPDEMLLNIFLNLNDTSLLNAIHLCHRLKCIAKEAFAKLYNGSTEEKHFPLNVCNENIMAERRQYAQFFSNFDIGGISIKFHASNAAVPENHWLIMLIQRHCMTVTSIIIANGSQIDLASIIGFTPKLTHLRLEWLKLRNDNWTKRNYPKMKCFSELGVKGMSPKAFAAFLMLNRQNLENVRFELPLNEIMNNGWLEMANLRILSVKTCKNSFVPFLSVLNGCKNIEELTIKCGLDDYDDNEGIMSMEHINLLCSFDKLNMLHLENFVLSLIELEVLVHGIPTLNCLQFFCAEEFRDEPEILLTIASLCRKFSKITLDTEICFDLSLFPYEFYTQYACRIGEDSNLKMEICWPPYTVTATRDEVRAAYYDKTTCNQIIFWKGYDPALSSTGKNLLELDTKVLLRIILYFDVDTLTAFLRTCRMAEQLVKRHLLQNRIYMSEYPMEFATFGEFISRLVITNVQCREVERKKLIQNVAKYCGKNLIELEIMFKLPADIETEIWWPNLQKLKFSYASIVSQKNLKCFRCPKLTHLEVWHYKNDEIVEVDWNDSFRNITSIQFGSYSEPVENFLYGISQRIRDQLKTLSLMKASDWFRVNFMRGWINLNLIISRCRRLENLHLHLPGMEDSNYKYVFENCSMLVELSVLLDSAGKSYPSHYEKLFAMLKSINNNCKNVQTVSLVGKSPNPSFLPNLYSLFPKVKVI